jgi:hypothetical protein
LIFFSFNNLWETVSADRKRRVVNCLRLKEVCGQKKKDMIMFELVEKNSFFVAKPLRFFAPFFAPHFSYISDVYFDDRISLVQSLQRKTSISINKNIHHGKRY